VEDGEPDFSDADEVFKLWRAWVFELGYTDLISKHRDKIKQTVIWNAEEGLKISGPQLARAEAKRTELYHRVRKFMERYEFMIFPVTQVPPFPVTTEYPTEIEGVQMGTYIDWMQSCYFITVTGLPAISVPCGFTPEGLPVGMQIVGRHQDDLGVLQMAHAFEQATQTWQQHPAVV
jgi:amidase